jgi:hypothetical protein
MAGHRTLLIVLLAWALLMIVPDLWRVVQPLGSFGFDTDNDGLIYDVTGPFPDITASPAWKAGLRKDDRLDLSRLRCIPYDAVTCGNALALLVLPYVVPGRKATVDFTAPNGEAREVTLVAEEEPANFLVRGVQVLDQIAGILVVLAAAWLVWTRPGGMSWGFFLYVLWFNPGQSFYFYALLLQWPVLLLAQYAAGCLAQGAGYAGLLLFVLRVPRDMTEPRWRPFERALPLLALVIALALIATYGSVFGYRTEMGTRAAILTGLVVALCAVVILMVRRRTQTPDDYQRVRWVLWGCLIGLPAFIIAELGQETTFFVTRWGDFTPPDDILGLLYLVNGVLCLFVFEAVRSQRVVSVSIPLRRVTILGLIFGIPALLLHHEIDRMQSHLNLPIYAWLIFGAIALFLISRLHETAVGLTDRYFNRHLDRAATELGQAILRAEKPAEIDRLLADEPFRVLKLTSAAAFRRKGSVFTRDENGNGWGSSETSTLRADEPMLAPLSKGAPFSLGDKDAGELGLLSGLKRPILAVPAANPIHCFAVALYGPHASGTDLDTYECGMLARIAEDAAAVYAELEINQLRSRIATFEQQVSTNGLRREPA